MLHMTDIFHYAHMTHIFRYGHMTLMCVSVYVYVCLCRVLSSSAMLHRTDIFHYAHMTESVSVSLYSYVVASVSKIDSIIGLF